MKLVLAFLGMSLLTFLGFMFMIIMIPNAIAVPLGAKWIYGDLLHEAKICGILAAFISLAGAVSILEGRLERRLKPARSSRYRVRRY